MYVPECWLNPGPNANTLVIYDEQGNLPNRVGIQSEAGASRDLVMYQSSQTVGENDSPMSTKLIAISGKTYVQMSTK